MAFEKMTAGALYDKFVKLFPNIIGEKCDKIGARMLRIETCGGPVLYFLWYDENNWNLGTKPYRNRPKKQIYSQVRKDLSTGKGMIEAFEKIYQVNSPKNEFGGVFLDEAVQEMKIAEARGLNDGFKELKTKSNDVITGCNQGNAHPDPTGIPGDRGVMEPIDWVKDDPDMLEKGIRVISGHTEWDDVVPTGETASTVDI